MRASDRRRWLAGASALLAAPRLSAVFAAPSAERPSEGAEPVAALGPASAIVASWSASGEALALRRFAGPQAAGTQLAPDLACPIGSVGKLVLGLAVLAEARERGVALTENIAPALGAHPLADMLGDRISLRELGCHLSGVPEPIANAALQAAVAAQPQRRFDEAEILAFAAAQPRRFAAGAREGYSNANSVLLGRWLRRVRGEPLAEALHARVLSRVQAPHPQYPADDGWRASGLRAWRHARRGQPVGYGTLLTEVTALNPSWAGAAGDWSGSLLALLALGRSLLHDPVLAPLLAQAAQMAGDVAAADAARYGFHVMLRDGWVGHTGDVPGFSAALWVHRERGAVRAALCNLSNFADGRNPADALLWQG